MTTVNETSGAKPQLGAGLTQGMQTLSGNEQVTFTLYVKLILPLDGFIFWVNATLLNDTAIYNALTYGFAEFNNKGSTLPSRKITVNGSFHFNTEMHQLEDRTTAYNHTIFTSPQLIQDFNLLNPNLLYVAQYEDLTFAFSRRDNYYKQADLYHYRGDSLYSIMNTQLINSMTDFDTTSVIVSNSLPIWLSLNQFFQMYPSYLVGQNISPPYASVDIQSTIALGQFPIVSNIAPIANQSKTAVAGYAVAGYAVAGENEIATQSSIQQLAKDTVKINIFGIRNQEALNFVNYIYQYSLNTDNIGMMNMPIIFDEKVTQPEFGIIAQKKSIIFEVSYYQNTVNDVALKLIQQAFITLTRGTVPV